MSPLSDKDLDRLSREAAEQFDVEGSASGWDQLEKKLDRELPVEEKKRRRRFWWFFFLAVGVGLATWGILSEIGNGKGEMGKGEEKFETRNSKLESENNQKQIAGSRKTAESGSLVAPPNIPRVDQPDNSPHITEGLPQPINKTSQTRESEIDKAEQKFTNTNTPERVDNKTDQNITSTLSSESGINKGEQKLPNTDKPKSANNTDQPTVSIPDNQKDANNTAQPKITNIDSGEPGNDNPQQKITYPVSPNSARDNAQQITNTDPRKSENENERQKITTPDSAAITPVEAQPNISKTDSSGQLYNPSNQTNNLSKQTNPSNQNNNPSDSTNNPSNQNNNPSNQINNPSNQNNNPSNQNKQLTSKPQKPDSGIVSQGLDTAAVSETANKKINSTSKGFEFGILGGVDASTVKFKGMSAPGINLGIVAGYRFNNRWSVNTGLIFTEKKYTAYGDDFNPPKGYWTYYVEMDKVDGVCSMWEIPLNIRYDISTKASSRWFLSGGASTYLMKKENYEYYYYYNGNYTNRYRSYPSSEKYFLSIINISGGYERTISRKFTLQVEPYIKVPVKGVGFGNINLNSFGTNFQLKFHPGR